MSLIPEVRQAMPDNNNNNNNNNNNGRWIETKNKINGQKVMFRDFNSPQGFTREQIIASVKEMNEEMTRQGMGDMIMAIPLFYGEVGLWRGGYPFPLNGDVILFADYGNSLGNITKYRIYIFKDKTAFRGKK